MYENIRNYPYLTLIISKSSTWTPYLGLVFKLRKSSSTRIYQAQKIDMGFGNCIVCRKHEYGDINCSLANTAHMFNTVLSVR